MNKRYLGLAIVSLGAICGSLLAQQASTPPAPAADAVAPLPAPRSRTSPHEIVSAVIGGNRVTLIYGRPYTKDPRSGQPRVVWGTLVPYDQVWRTGADEATLLITQKPIEIGGATVPAGAYTLWTLPAKDGTAKLIINKQIGQWGLAGDIKTVYDPTNDLARVDLKKDTISAPVDQFTMTVQNTQGANPPAGVIKMQWDTTQYSVPFTVKP